MNNKNITRSDLIPQPVTDEAREMALDEFPLNTNDIKTQRDVYMWFLVHENTIKAALSQPVVKDCLNTQPEAIQKAVQDV